MGLEEDRIEWENTSSEVDGTIDYRERDIRLRLFCSIQRYF